MDAGGNVRFGSEADIALGLLYSPKRTFDVSACYVPRTSSNGLVEIRTKPSATLAIIRR
jgi:hypothetical protein